MTIHLGYVAASTVLYIPFHTFDSNGASVTITGLAVTDIEIYKNGSTTQRSSDNGYTLLDTDGIDFDGVTGIHGISIDLSDNTDAGFYAAGSFYWVVIASITADTRTVNFVAATFFIGPVAANVTQLLGTAWLTPGTAGTPDVNTKLAGGTAWGSGAITAGSIASDAITAAKVADGTIDAATFATGAITAAAIAADAIGASELAADAVTEIQSGLATSAALSTVAGYIDTEVAAIKAVTDVLPNAGALTTIQADLDDIQTRIPAALVGGRIDANVGAISTDATAADNAEAFFDGTGYAGTNNVIPTVTTLTGNTPQTGDAYAVVNSGTHGNAAIKGYVDDIGAAGAGLTAVPWNAAWDAEVQSEVQDALDATLADSIPSDGTRPSIAQALYMLTQFMNERSVSGTTVTVKKVDGSTTLFTLTLNDDTAPTSITRAS